MEVESFTKSGLSNNILSIIFEFSLNRLLPGISLSVKSFINILLTFSFSNISSIGVFGNTVKPKTHSLFFLS